MNTIDPFFSEISQQIHKMYEKVAIIIQIWHKAKSYFTSMSNTWYPITTNMNKITTFFFTISQNSKFRKKLAYLLKFGTETNSILHALVARDTWWWYSIWRKSIQPSWRNAQGQTSRQQTDGQTDWTLSYISRFCLGGA